MNMMDSPPKVDPLLQLVGLSRRARLAASAEELAFLAVNDTRALCAYRQAALWFADGGIKALSGVVEPDTNAPYVQWFDRVCRLLRETHPKAATVDAIQLPGELASEWVDWLPSHGLWLPFAERSDTGAPGGLLLASDSPWSEHTITLLQEWMGTWYHMWSAQALRSAWSWHRVKQTIAGTGDGPWWKRRTAKVGAVLLAASVIPVRLSILAPGELVSANPAVIRAPVDGVIGQIQVQPNQTVKAGQLLFTFDDASIATRRDVAAQALSTAHAEYRQYAQQAVSDAKSKSQLALMLGKIEEKRAEADYYKDLLERSRVTAPQDGIVLFDDPSEWTGKPVQIGERIMRIATPGDVEVEAWLPIGDAIPLPDNAEVSLYLAATPLSAIPARIRYVAHDAVPRPDGTYAYRVRARIEERTNQRIGSKGTAKISGDWVPLIYWIIRRPLSTIRQALGL